MDQSGASETAIGITSAATKRQLVYLIEQEQLQDHVHHGHVSRKENIHWVIYPTTKSNGLESRTTKSEFFWVYFGAFLTLGLRDRKRDPKTLIIYFIKNPIRCAATPRISLTRSELT